VENGDSGDFSDEFDGEHNDVSQSTINNRMWKIFKAPCKKL